MTFPLGGNAGWEELGTFTDDAPRSVLLPAALIADWYDPAPLGGAGGLRPAVVVEVGASTVVVRGAMEARFTQVEVWGVAVLDSIGVFQARCSLLLEVFDDDRETLLWDASTDPLHARPYLMEPEELGEQEVDFAQGGASLGSMVVEVIDKALTAGDQDSGFMMGKLARGGYGDLHGRRCRVSRFISPELGMQVILDGPAGAPSMGAEYSSIRLPIRDQREAERKVRLFTSAGSAAGGLRSLVPDELVDGYGYDAPSNTYLVRPGIPLKGHSNRHAFYPSPAVATLSVGASEFPEQTRRLLVWKEAYDAVIDGIGRAQNTPEPNPEFTFKWRAAGTSNTWNEIPGSALGVSLSSATGTVTEDTRVIGQVVIEDRRVNPLDALYDNTVAQLPGENDIVEFYLLGPVPTNERHPVVLDSKVVPGVPSPLNPDGGDLLVGNFNLVASIGGTSSGTIVLDANPEEMRRHTVPVFNRLTNLSTSEDIFIPSSGLFTWRAAGSSDPFTDITLQPALPGGASALLYLELPLRETSRVFTVVQLTADDADVPSNGQAIEFGIFYQSGAQELLEVTVGLTTGDVVKNVYDGVYSRRGVDGELVPLRGGYDPAALALMDTPVRMRITEPVDDARDWLEKVIFAPDGWAPALDQQGLLSPVSQVPPASTTGLPEITRENGEPAPDWDAGQRVINVVRFTYYRDYDPGTPDPHVGSDDTWATHEKRQSVIRGQAVPLEFRDPLAVEKLGEQVLELDGSAFTALGKIPDDIQELLLPPDPQIRRIRRVGRYLTRDRPVTATPVVIPAFYIEPISGAQADETGYQVALLRQLHLHNRYALGAQAMALNVMRSAHPTLRAGSWVVVSLPWLPDYTTGRRGLAAMAQVLSLGDLDCAWRHVLVEVVVPIPSGS